MNKNAKKWVKALRSGKYKQTKDALRSDDKFCCLGVACELAAKAGVIPFGKQDRFGDFSYDGEETSLPQSVIAWLELRDSAGRFKGDSLAGMNDAGRRFKTIADIIESEPEGLFR